MYQMGLPVLQPGTHFVCLCAVEAIVARTLLQEKENYFMLIQRATDTKPQTHLAVT